MIPSSIERYREKLAELCRNHKVRELSVFGSQVRGEATAKSDYDLLIEFMPGSEVDLFSFVKIQNDIADLMNAEVDLVSKNGLRPALRKRVLSEAEVIYAA